VAVPPPVGRGAGRRVEAPLSVFLASSHRCLILSRELCGSTGGKMIDSYDFGRVVIDGKSYTSDVIIYPDGVRDQWFRREGHKLCRDDLGDVLDKEPEVIVVGTGNPGLMRVLPETEKLIDSKRIKLIVQPTGEACRAYNHLATTQKVIALLHLTC
ncbi:MAG: hypothetical protein JSV10_03335, partial [Candidatus Zixiibacteriota bacterium]